MLDKKYGLGDHGRTVRIIQEWLCLQGFLVTIDGDFGPATARAVRLFQQDYGLTSTGEVNDAVFTRLQRPLVNAMRDIEAAPGVTDFNALLIAYAQQHLRQHPREVGGQNQGPWVRFYMEEHEGADWPWCAGFAMTVLKQTCRSLGVALPFEPSISCDELAKRATSAGLFVSELDAQLHGLPAGSLFLVRKSAADWTHVGIVTHAVEDAFDTIEGNTNDEGSREGYEVCARTRGFKDKDFIVWRP